MDNKKLLIIFVALLAVYFGYDMLSGNQERSFKSEIVEVDTEQITQINLFPKAENNEQVTISKIGDGWEVAKGNFKAAATEASVNSLLEQSKLIKAKRVASKNTAKWKEYEVDDSTGTKVQLLAGGKTMADFIVGKFNVNQQARTFTSYVRLTGKNEVYEVDGFLSTVFNQKLDNFRNKTLAQFNPADITAFSIQTETGIDNYSKVVGNWSASDGTSLDSTKVTTYLNGLQNLMGSNFINDFSPVNTPDKSISISGNNMTAPINIKCYNHQGAQPFVIHSNLNEAAYFLSDSSGVYAKLFKMKTDFLN